MPVQFRTLSAQITSDRVWVYLPLILPHTTRDSALAKRARAGTFTVRGAKAKPKVPLLHHPLTEVMFYHHMHSQHAQMAKHALALAL